MSRKQQRELAFQQIYSLSFNPVGVCDDSTNEEFTTTIISHVKQNLDSIDKLIKTHAKDFSFDRIFKIDLACLRLGIAEILYTDTPPVVAINEVVALAKKYSTEHSASFVNGILANISKQ